jgi:hypothetical protein
MRACLTALILTVLAGGHALLATNLSTDDGLHLTLDDATGAVTELRVDGASLPLLGSTASLIVQVGIPGSPVTAHALSFESDGGPWVSADNADWDDAGDFATWLPSGGVGDSGHLLLGNGSRVGVGIVNTGLKVYQAAEKKCTTWAVG